VTSDNFRTADRADDRLQETGDELAARFQSDAIPLIDPLFGAALRLTRHQAHAEDLVQETILRAYIGFRSFRDGANLKAWLFRILHNNWINAYRKHQRQPTQVWMDDVPDRHAARYAATAPTGLRSAEVEVLEALPDLEIQAALLSLPEEFRMAVYYADVEGFSYAEIADIMNTPVGTVMSRLHRGRRQLCELLFAVAAGRGLLPSGRCYSGPLPCTGGEATCLP
jgi:RNA polymerase sigma-70 factor, ECF subfamily